MLVTVRPPALAVRSAVIVLAPMVTVPLTFTPGTSSSLVSVSWSPLADAVTLPPYRPASGEAPTDSYRATASPAVCTAAAASLSAVSLAWPEVSVSGTTEPRLAGYAPTARMPGMAAAQDTSRRCSAAGSVTKAWMIDEAQP